MYLSSTIYHATSHPKKKKFLQVLDHCSIYVLIAGTYTPFTFITLRNNNGYFILTIVWVIAILGIAFKIIWKDKYDLIATLGYLAAGWVILIDIQKFYEIFPKSGFNWILVGGLLYTIGAIFYLIEKLPRNHEIWHGFVLLASFCHFQAVYFYL
jgi:hemolysin III